MKLMRYGAKGSERPGLIDSHGRVRSLSGVVADIGPDELSPTGLASLRSVDPAVLVHEMRLRKNESELATMRRASEITRHAHLRAMDVARPGAHEYEVEAEILGTFRRFGAQRPAYGPIVGGGLNATILHYRRNDQPLREGDLLLIDAGAELDYYAADVTRTFPVSGRFSTAQRALYDIVLEAQLQAIEAVRPGVTLEDLHRLTVRVLTEGLVKIGLLRMSASEAIETGAYKQFYMHRTSHWLGMDVHDVGAYFTRGEPRAMEPGMVLTIEPGLYVGAHADVDPAFRGIGIRIEDDIAVTASGHEVLTDVPKQPSEIEKILAARV